MLWAPEGLGSQSVTRSQISREGVSEGLSTWGPWTELCIGGGRVSGEKGMGLEVPCPGWDQESPLSSCTWRPHLLTGRLPQVGPGLLVPVS